MQRIMWNLVLGGMCLSLGGCNFAESKFVEICEQQIKERLNSPSGYARFELTEYSEPKSVEDFIIYQKNHGQELSEDSTRLLKLSGAKPIMFVAHIKYDAPNVFGTPMREISECTYFSRDGSKDSAYILNVRVDGKTNHERLMDAASQ